MKHVTLKEAHRLISKALAVRVEDGAVIEPSHPSLYPLVESDENVFLYLVWEDISDGFYTAKFAEGDNQVVPVDGGKLTLTDTEGERYELLLLAEFDAEHYVPEEEA